MVSTKRRRVIKGTRSTGAKAPAKRVIKGTRSTGAKR